MRHASAHCLLVTSPATSNIPMDYHTEADASSTLLTSWSGAPPRVPALRLAVLGFDGVPPSASSIFVPASPDWRQRRRMQQHASATATKTTRPPAAGSQIVVTDRRLYRLPELLAVWAAVVGASDGVLGWIGGGGGATEVEGVNGAGVGVNGGGAGGADFDSGDNAGKGGGDDGEAIAAGGDDGGSGPSARAGDDCVW